MKKFTLYTQTNKNLGMLVSEFFPSFFLSNGKGKFHGTQEDATQIVIISKVNDDFHRDDVLTLADAIKRNNNQAEVLITEEDVNAEVA